jgi:RHS repeat-associated protein
MQILYSYDDLNRTTEIKRYVDGSNDEILMDNTQYDTEGLLTQLDYGNDLQATFSYDSLDRISTIDVKNGATSFLDLDYTYDSNNNITQLVNGWRDTSSTWNSETESYSYDGLDRLTSASCTSWSHTYTYDKVGNRTGKGSVTYTINTVNEVTALSDGTSFTYDDNGNRTQKTKGTDTWDYTYDYADRLTKVEENSSTTGEYVYDGKSKRLQATENSTTTTYIHFGYGVLYEETSSTSAAYVYGPTGLLAKRTTAGQESHTYYYHTDHLESTRLVTDESKNIISAITYHPFGEPDDKEGSEDFLFTGKERDSTGLFYYGARYYDPDIGRFLTRDPMRKMDIENPQNLNKYTYCLNNPVKFIDPDGAECLNYSHPGTQREWRRTKSIHSGTEEYKWVEYNYGEGFMLLVCGQALVLCYLAGTIGGILLDVLLDTLKENDIDVTLYFETAMVEITTGDRIFNSWEDALAYIEMVHFEPDTWDSIIRVDEDTIMVTYDDGDTVVLLQRDENGRWRYTIIKKAEEEQDTSDDDTTDDDTGSSTGGSGSGSIPPIGPTAGQDPSIM